MKTILQILPWLLIAASLVVLFLPTIFGTESLPYRFGQMGATLGQNGKVTLLDMAKSVDPDGTAADVAELLSQTNEILLDMPFFEGNLVTGHRHTVRTGMPTAIWRQMYQGVPASKSVRAQVEDSIGMLEARSEVDVEAANLYDNQAAFRLSEADSFIEAMNQTMAQTLFYGNTTVNPERFTGLAPRYSVISGATNAQNIIDAGGTGSDNTSVWLVVWGKSTAFGIYPKGSKVGLSHQDLGEYDALDANNNRYRALGDLWKWKMGMTVRDWRFIVRICNIDVSDLVGQTGTQATAAATLLIKLMVKAMARIPAMGKGKAVFYANRTIKEMLSIQALDRNQNVLAFQPGLNEFGAVSPGSVNNGTLTFQGIPVRTVDQLLSTEARVV